MFGHVMPDEQDTYDYYEYITQQREAYAKWIKKLKKLLKIVFPNMENGSAYAFNLINTISMYNFCSFRFKDN